ncbi:MAG: hypothetical protein PHC28_12515 [Flavobacterium sp.]|uniref:hypothetical protein n=1 Tax=Flavobacterium sp. TaxID=239 RepID=UPI002633A36B|nr:hypothetical protein [Flavobacterium sp.]MDD5151275.1 hypothetical protein [Flavobacterium sp.]
MVDENLYKKLLTWYDNQVNNFSDKDLIDLQHLGYVINVTYDNDFCLTKKGKLFIINYIKQQGE